MGLRICADFYGLFWGLRTITDFKDCFGATDFTDFKDFYGATDFHGL